MPGAAALEPVDKEHAAEGHEEDNSSSGLSNQELVGGLSSSPSAGGEQPQRARKQAANRAAVEQPAANKAGQAKPPRPENNQPCPRCGSQ